MQVCWGHHPAGLQQLLDAAPVHRGRQWKVQARAAERHSCLLYQPSIRPGAILKSRSRLLTRRRMQMGNFTAQAPPPGFRMLIGNANTRSPQTGVPFDWSGGMGWECDQGNGDPSGGFFLGFPPFPCKKAVMARASFPLAGMDRWIAPTISPTSLGPTETLARPRTPSRCRGSCWNSPTGPLA